MKRLSFQYSIWRNVGFNRSKALRLALRDCGFKPFSFFLKRGVYHHAINNWSITP